MKHNLKFKINYDINFVLIGIQSQIKDYQFAYFLNSSPFFLFQRMARDISYIIQKKKIYFTTFQDFNSELKRKSFLIKNQALYSSVLNQESNLFNEKNVVNTTFLIPELKEFDYFIKLIGVWKTNELSELKRFLHSIPGVDPQANININQIKSINNLIF